MTNISAAIILVLSIDSVLCSCTGVLTSDTEHSYTVHWSIQQSVVQFNVSANIGSDKWIGLGFSSTAGMVSNLVFMCEVKAIFSVSS